MATPHRRHSKEEFARRGAAIYENDVRPQLKPTAKGKFVAIDIESGSYEIAADEMKAGNKLRKRIPEAQIWMVRVGSRSVHRSLARWCADCPGRLITIYHQNVTTKGKSESEKEKVQEGELRMESLQKGGWVKAYRPVPPDQVPKRKPFSEEDGPGR